MTVSKDRAASKQETRDALVAAGLAEFAARGLDAPSLDSICARAGFTRGAFYVHFRDRDDFLEAVMEKVFRSFLDAIIVAGDGASDLEETITRFAAIVSGAAVSGHRPAAMAMEIHRVLDACARSPLLKKRFVTLLAGAAERVALVVERGQQAGSVRPDVDASAVAELLAVLAFGVITAIDTGVPLHFEKMRDAVLRLVRGGTAAPG
ncbi:MAG TPA: TetR/AcrR family transcriptional regulator [Candidatus Binatia bacterium]|jgi:AcrR family transcriptional regulator